MKIQGNFTFNADRAKVWDALLSPDILADCIPGCQSLEPDGPNAYKVAMRVGVAAVRGSYTGGVTLADLDHPHSYRMIVQGRGAGGSARGEAIITLTDAPGNATQIAVSGDAQVTGVIARVGQRLMGNASRMLMTQFFTCLQSKVETQTDPQTNA